MVHSTIQRIFFLFGLGVYLLVKIFLKTFIIITYIYLNNYSFYFLISISTFLEKIFNK